MNEKPVIVAAGGLVQNEKGELLVIFRRGKWDLPKGKLDEGESIEACALREVEEETGLHNLTLGAPITVTRHEYFDKYIGADVVKESHWFRMTTVTQPLVPQTEEDITDIRWVSGEGLRECLENTYPAIIDVITKAGLTGNSR